MHPGRIRRLNQEQSGPGPVVYWMSRDQRIADNWALIFAQETALEGNRALLILFCLTDSFLGAGRRQFEFMLKGLQETSARSLELNIPFVLLFGDPGQELPKFIRKTEAGTLITDFDPLLIKKKWKNELLRQLSIPFYEVDAHNIVPCWQASDKQEYSARTLRSKLYRSFPEYFEHFPRMQAHPQPPILPLLPLEQTAVDNFLTRLDTGPAAAEWIQSGEKAGMEMLHGFMHSRLGIYARQKNDPNSEALSGLSPYLHFGQIAPQRVALEISAQEDAASEDKEVFLEELTVRRELADNFCFYSSDYASAESLPQWALDSLEKHNKDQREHIYSLQEFESALTHDPLWNAAQMQMVRSGKMHGYMRMYWAKKILQWSPGPQQAIDICIYLNDKYELDGRDPNGYAGILWAVGGLHDRAFKERPVFGKVRYMNYNGCRRKFDVQSYMDRWAPEDGARQEKR